MVVGVTDKPVTTQVIVTVNVRSVLIKVVLLESVAFII
jgi:hypothetical protein